MKLPYPISNEAQKHLEDWLSEQEEEWRDNGADVAEVNSDVMAHLSAKFQDRKEPVELAELEKELATLAPEKPIRQNKEKTTPRDYNKERPFRKILKFLVCNPFRYAVWPVAVIIFEIASGFCESIFFNPIPSTWHLLLTSHSSVPSLGFKQQLDSIKPLFFPRYFFPSIETFHFLSFVFVI